MDTARKTFDSVLGAGTVVLDKARELPQKLPASVTQKLPASVTQTLNQLPERIGDLPQKLQALPQQITDRVGEYVTLPQSIKVGPVDLRDLPATLQAYAAKGTERALALVGETREFIKQVKVAPVTTASNGNGNGAAKAAKPAAAKKPAAKPRTAKKATVAKASTTE